MLNPMIGMCIEGAAILGVNHVYLYNMAVSLLFVFGFGKTDYN